MIIGDRLRALCPQPHLVAQDYLPQTRQSSPSRTEGIAPDAGMESGSGNAVESSHRPSLADFEPCCEFFRCEDGGHGSFQVGQIAKVRSR